MREQHVLGIVGVVLEALNNLSHILVGFRFVMPLNPKILALPHTSVRHRVDWPVSLAFRLSHLKSVKDNDFDKGRI